MIIPKVSVIIPAYKAEKYIKATIESVLNQTMEDFEVLVIDDGSPDHQASIVKEVMQKDSRVSYFLKENGGVSSARNFGYKHAKGEFLAFLDADDLWLPNNLEKKIDYFNQYSSLGLVHSDAQVIDAENRSTGAVNKGKEGDILEDLLSWNGTCIPAPSSILVKKEVLENVGLFNEKLSNSADQEFFFRVANQYKVGRVKEVTWQYRVHDENMHKNITLMEKDLLLTYKLASESGLFRNRDFEKKCYGNMYMVLGASWYGDGKSKVRGIYYLLKSLFIYPGGLKKVINKVLG